jgi:hypothetical protein
MVPRRTPDRECAAGRVGAGQDLGTLADRLAAVRMRVANAHCAGVGSLHRVRSCLLRSVVEDLRARGIRPHHIGRVHEILLVGVGLAGEEHFAVAGHDPAVELAVDGTVDLELDHGGWFSSSCVPGGAHQRRVIRGRRAGFSQLDLTIVIILMSKLRTHLIREPIGRYAPIDRGRAGHDLASLRTGFTRQGLGMIDVMRPFG